MRIRLLVPLLSALLLVGGCGDGDGSGGLMPAEIDLITFGVSQIKIDDEKGRPQPQAETLINQAARALAAGSDFATVARGRSDDESKEDGGFLGFVNGYADTAFSGAVQATPPGQISQPVRTQFGWHIVKRHTFEEARQLEQRLRVPVRGVIIGWDNPKNPGMLRTGRTREQAHLLATELLGKLSRGDLTWDLAMEAYTPKPMQAPGAWLGFVARRGPNVVLFDALKDAEPGQLLGPFDTPKGMAVVMRGRYLRSLFRHVLIQHREATDAGLTVRRGRAEAKKIAEKVLKEALANPGQWDRLVETYSDDKWSRTLRGRLGVLHTGHMPKGFEQFVFDMPPNSIHDQVVETPGGYHVVWRVN